MKKFFACLFAGCMILGLSTVALATTEGEVFKKGSDGYISETVGTSLVPGNTYYVYICAGTNSIKPSSKASVTYTCVNNETDKKFSIMGSSLPISKKKMSSSSNDYGYFAEMKLKEIPISSYSFDGFALDFTKFNESKAIGGDVSNIVGSTFTVAYSQGSEITDEPQYFELEDTSDYYYVEGTGAEVTIDSEGVKTKTIISCGTSYDSNFGDKYSNANLNFYYFNGAKLRRAATVTIPVSDGKYLYEVASSGLREITKKNGDKFEFKTQTLGKYVLSDKKLADTHTPGVPVNPTIPSVTPNPVPEVIPGAPTGGNQPFNPGTGAAV